MDILLSKITQQAMNYAIRSGITITSTYAISQCSRLLKTKDGREKDDLAHLQRRLQSKIRIISPAIDMIELITARGNTSLESALTLTQGLRWDIQNLGVRLSRAAADEELSQKNSSKASSQAARDLELKQIIGDMKRLLERIEDAVPLINLAITTSGVSLSTNLPPTISPSRLLQASTFLSAGDAQYASKNGLRTQVGPTFTLSVYMLFQGHAFRDQTEESLRSTTWQEVIHKAQLKLLRTSLRQVQDLPDSHLEYSGYGNDSEYFFQSVPGQRSFDEFAYQLLIVEDLDDDRVHTFEDEQQKPEPYDEVALAGIREIVPIHQISRIFYADTGKILNIGTEGETNNPILLIKRDSSAIPPRRMMHDEDDGLPGEDSIAAEANSSGYNEYEEAAELEAQFARDSTPLSVTEEPLFVASSRPWALPSNLDPEWIALEIYEELADSDDEHDDGHDTNTSDSPQKDALGEQSRRSSLVPNLASALSKLHIGSEPGSSPSRQQNGSPVAEQISDEVAVPRAVSNSRLLPIRSSLSLLEMLIRLTSLQQFQQASHLTINDELLNFFLDEASTTGAATGDAEARRRIRLQARHKLGFDPYDESPIKRRGEYHQQQANTVDEDQDRLWNRTPSQSPRPKQWPSSQNGIPTPPHAKAMRSPLRSGQSTPLRQVAQSSIERSRFMSPLHNGTNSKDMSVTPPAVWTTSRSTPQNGISHGLSGHVSHRDLPLDSVESGKDAGS